MDLEANLSGIFPLGSKRRKNGDSLDVSGSKRLKVSTACDLCRAKKVKCDGIQPECGPCMRRKDRKSGCTWADGTARSNQLPSSEHVLQLEKRIRELEQDKIANLGQNGSRVSTHNPSNTDLLDLSVSSPTMIFQNPDDVFTEVPHNGADRRPANKKTLKTKPTRRTSLSIGAPSSSVGGITEAATSAMIGSTESVINHGFFGSSSAGSFISQIKRSVDQKFGSQGTRILPPGGEHFQGLFEKPNAKREVTDYILPPRKKADELLNAYWNAVYPLYPFVDKVETIELYEGLWADRDSIYDESGFFCLVNLIFAISSQINVSKTAKQRQNSSQIFLERAQKFLNLWESGSVRSVQSFLILAQYLQSTNEPYQCWMCVGLAVRTAQSLGLHLTETIKQVSSPRRRELLIRVWNGCILMDRVIAMTYGRPTMIEKSIASAVPLPASIDDEYLTSDPSLHPKLPNHPSKIDFFINSLKLYEIMHEILIGFYSPTADLSNDPRADQYFGLCNTHDSGLSILDIDMKLMKWENNLPAHLQHTQEAYRHITLEHPVADSGIFARQAIVLRQRFLHVRLLSLRPILSKFVSSDISDSSGLSSFGNMLSCRIAHQCSVVCVKVAQEAIKLVHIHRSADSATSSLLGAWWYNVLFIYSAATVLIAARLRPSIITELEEDSILSSWKVAIEVLQGYSTFSDSIPKLIATLLVLSDKVPTRYSYHRQQNSNNRPQNTRTGVDRQLLDQPQDSNWSGHDQMTDFTANTTQEVIDFGPIDSELLSSFDDLPFDPGDLSWLNAVPFEF